MSQRNPERVCFGSILADTEKLREGVDIVVSFNGSSKLENACPGRKLKRKFLLRRLF